MAVSGANLIAIAITAVISLVMPLALNLEGYAYWQLFSLYSSLAGFFVLGFNDGIFQKYADLGYDSPLINRLASMKWIVVGLGVLGASTILASSLFFPHDKRFAITATAICVLFYGLNGFLTYTNQIGARFHIFASSVLIERVSLMLGTVALFAAGVRDYRWFVLVSVIGSLLKLFYLAARTSEVMFGRGMPVASLRLEIADSFRTGFPVMLAILMGGSILIPSRLWVESTLGPASFALYSFALTAVMITGTILSSLAQSIFPLFRKMDGDAFIQSIGRTHGGLTLASTVLLFLYFLAAVAIRVAYPHFEETLRFLGILFPLFIFQSKYLILLTTMHRVRNRIRRMLLVAATGVVMNLVAAVIVGQLTRSVLWLSVGTLVAYVIWLTIWWLEALRKSGLPWGVWDNIELGITALFLFCLAVPHLIGAPPHLDLLISCASYAIGLLVLAAPGHRWLRRELSTILTSVRTVP